MDCFDFIHDEYKDFDIYDYNKSILNEYVDEKMPTCIDESNKRKRTEEDEDEDLLLKKKNMLQIGDKLHNTLRNKSWVNPKRRKLYKKYPYTYCETHFMMVNFKARKINECLGNITTSYKKKLSPGQLMVFNLFDIYVNQHKDCRKSACPVSYRDCIQVRSYLKHLLAPVHKVCRFKHHCKWEEQHLFYKKLVRNYYMKHNKVVCYSIKL
ncbi:MAG: hypothetical protein CMH46_00415 [Muricauda sp.]|nr:hypothetical protein [Allomuricauda sp.]